MTDMMNSEHLIGILTSYSALTVEEVANMLLFNARNDGNFQQDNCARQTSRAAKNQLTFTGNNYYEIAISIALLEPNWACLVCGQTLTVRVPELSSGMHE